MKSWRENADEVEVEAMAVGGGRVLRQRLVPPPGGKSMVDVGKRKGSRRMQRSLSEWTEDVRSARIRCGKDVGIRTNDRRCFVVLLRTDQHHQSRKEGHARSTHPPVHSQGAPEK